MKAVNVAYWLMMLAALLCAIMAQEPDGWTVAFIILIAIIARISGERVPRRSR